MDRLVWIAWRAFWVGLGASAVMIGQSVVQPSGPSAPPSTPAPVVEPLPAPVAPAADLKKAADPITRKPLALGSVGRKS
jgi:hypothetical protein